MAPPTQEQSAIAGNCSSGHISGCLQPFKGCPPPAGQSSPLAVASADLHNLALVLGPALAPTSRLPFLCPATPSLSCSGSGWCFALCPEWCTGFSLPFSHDLKHQLLRQAVFPATVSPEPSKLLSEPGKGSQGLARHQLGLLEEGPRPPTAPLRAHLLLWPAAQAFSQQRTVTGPQGFLVW